ncbi:MAG: LytTR family transcriptional regulator DNA-binding domain-containing protein [Alistipes sp.]|nr:LytTR family transcriptional regulator DNA-binding domain-containing protein [Alistipes sp.]
MAYREIPKFLVSRRYISVVITFIVVFSVIFMLVYRPFSLAIWFSTNDTLRFSFTLLFYVAAIVTLITSRWLMNRLQDRLTLTSTTYIWWIMGENLLISLLYTLITVKLFPVEGVATPAIAVRALICVTMILAIPNGIIALYAAYHSKCEELEATQYQLQRISTDYQILKNLKDSDIRAAAEALQMSKQPMMPRMVSLYDNNNTLRLTINVDSLYYLESEDNYVKVHYKHNDKITSYMLRCRTSTIEKSLEGTPMVRCHRSYIVNINKVRFLGEEHRMHYLTLDDESIKHIPVSKTYYTSLLDALNVIMPRA